MIHLHAIPEDQLASEIEALRAQAAACATPTDLLVVNRYHALVRRLGVLTDELRRRQCGPEKKRRKPKPRRWTDDLVLTPAAKNVWSRPRQITAEEPKPAGGLAGVLGIV